MWCTWKVVVLPIKPVVYFFTFSLRSLRWILKSLLSIYKIRPESFRFFFFFIIFQFNSVSLHEKAKFWRILKRAVFTMASFNLLQQIPSGFCSLLQVGAFNLLHQIPSGFCSLLQVRALFIFKILSGITKFKYERKNEINSFISKNK